MKKQILGLALAAALTSGAAQGVVIDDFDVGSQSVTTLTSDTLATLSAIGGFRTIALTSILGPLGAAVDVLAPPGIYSHSSDALTSATSKLTWNTNGAGLGGVDLTEGLIDNVFSFNILGIDVGAIDFTIMVEDVGGFASSVDFLNPGIGVQTVAFADFVGTADFTNINVIMLTVIGDVASDLTLDLLETTGTPPTNVPAPGTLALLGLGLAAFGLRRRPRA